MKENKELSLLIENMRVAKETENIIKNYRERYGNDADFYITGHPISCMVSKEIKQNDTPETWAQLTLHLIHFLGIPEDPTPSHFVACRAILNKNEEDIPNEIIDKFAREILIKCQEFKNLIITHEWVENKKNGPVIHVSSKEDTNVLMTEKNGLLWLDDIFLEFLSNIGPESKKIAEIFAEDSRKRLSVSKKNNKLSKAWALWVDAENPLVGPFLKPIAKGIWEDKIKPELERKQKYFPALPSGVMETIKPSLQRTSKIIQSKESIDIVESSGKIVASAQIPCIDAKIIPLVTRGIKSFGSLAGHRLLRWQVKSGCQNIVDGAPNPNTLNIAGGFETISHLIGCGENKSTVTEVKSILYAQSHSSFYLSNGDRISSLIILKEIGYHRNGEPNKLSIILGDVLLPHFLFNLPQNERRLIPIITDLPPLIGSPNTHAAQAMLQLLVLEEFSKQSDRFAESGSVLIPLEKWEQLSQNASLPKSSLPKVILGWTTDSTNGTTFLKRAGDEYALSDVYLGVEKFLENQGKMRMIGKKGGMASAEKILEKKQKILKS